MYIKIDKVVSEEFSAERDSVPAVVLVSNIAYVEGNKGGNGSRIFLLKQVHNYNWLEAANSPDDILKKIAEAEMYAR